MASPYENYSVCEWDRITEDLIAEHPLSEEEIVDAVLDAWDRIKLTKIGGELQIGVDVFPSPQIMGNYLHELIPVILAHKHPGIWRKAMISLIRKKVLLHGWLTEGELLNMIAVSESTPGPIAVNMATFVCSAQGGILGSFFTTLGVVFQFFIIILLIAALIRNLLKYKAVQAFLSGIRPCVVGLILATAVTLFLSTVVGMTSVNSEIQQILEILRFSAFLLRVV